MPEEARDARAEGEARGDRRIIDENDAVLHQSKADDEWARYQAMSVVGFVHAT